MGWYEAGEGVDGGRHQSLLWGQQGQAAIDGRRCKLNRAAPDLFPLALPRRLPRDTDMGIELRPCIFLLGG